jgi:hypothetical protein
MANSEEILGIIYDVILPLDVHARYDIYFTDKRIAIVCMGSSNRIDYKTLGNRSLLSVAVGVAPAVLMYADEKRMNKKVKEEQVNDLSVDEILKLSKKSTFYTYEEIEKIELVSAKEQKLIILSDEYESAFSPTVKQFDELCSLLPTIGMLKDKLILPHLRSNQILPKTEENMLSLENKELKKENEALKDRIKQLETENTDLRCYIDTLKP